MGGDRRIVLDSVVGDGVAAHRLDDAAAHYVTNVLRLAAGDRVDALERGGMLLRGELAWRDGHPWLVGIKIAPADAPRRAVVVLAGIIKPNRWEWMLEKAVELGATTIAPWACDRAVIRVPEQKVAARVARWQRIADGAARQCGRPDVVDVTAPWSLAEALERWPDHRWLRADEADTGAGWPTLAPDEPLVLVFGPEGGFSEPERATLAEAGATALGLGRSLLRAETAVVCALSGLRLRDDALL